MNIVETRSRKQHDFSFDLIAAVNLQSDNKWGIGMNGDIPWKNTPAGREDMKFFHTITNETEKTCLIMGRKTWESIPAKFRPLPGRINVVISSTYDDATTITGWLTDTPVVFVGSFNAAIRWVKNSSCKRTFVIGGAQVYAEAMISPYLLHSYITLIPGEYMCDTFILPTNTLSLVSFNVRTCTYKVYVNENHDEKKYHNLCQHLINAPIKPNRTGISAHSLFHEVLKFDLGRNDDSRILPLITSKFTAFKVIYHELIWFLRGCKDSHSELTPSTKYLEDNGVKIWRGNTSREFLDNRGLEHLDVGETGPIYGVQWRSRNDQLADVIERLKTNPFDRRLIVSSWNVNQLDEMCIPPCHFCFQFVVTTDYDGTHLLNCIVNMRSADVGLGVPFNIVSYALLTHMVSQITMIKPGQLSISMADCHLYENHVDGIKKMLTRTPRLFPTLTFSPNILKTLNLNIDHFARDFTINDYEINRYVPYPAINLHMAV